MKHTPMPPGAPPPSPPSPPNALEDSAQALRDLHQQLLALNAHLEYLRLILKLGVR